MLGMPSNEIWSSQPLVRLLLLRLTLVMSVSLGGKNLVITEGIPDPIGTNIKNGKIIRIPMIANGLLGGAFRLSL